TTQPTTNPADPTATMIINVATLPPTNTPTSPSQPTSPPAPTSPPIPYPNGDRFLLFYNENGFYFYNDSPNDYPTSSLLFQRLNASGSPTNQFWGSQWARFYPNIQSGGCTRIEIVSTNTNPPAQCTNSNNNSTRNTVPEADDVFWTTQGTDATQFRVMWNSEEVGRCDISVGQCTIFLPSRS
ncbi:MAG TPA: hypothetical protein VLL52_03895, partial [Anaerolineae bacterium]|nr:hypothetical protein [Anaerolineae bacterium]